jgi:CheY-like chemotaxis protein
MTHTRGLRSYSVYQLPSLVGEEIQYYDIIAVEPPVLVSKPASFLSSGFAHDANNHLLIGSANIQAAERLLGAHHPALQPLKSALSAITQASAIYAQARKLEHGIIPQPTTVDVGLEFQEVIKQCKPLLSDGITLMTLVECGHIFVRVDPTHLRQILTNLILNAREALQDHGTITLAATRKGKDSEQRCPIHGYEVACLSVSDNGPGIELPLLETLFTPFVSTKSSDTPRGLGLAMVKTLIERNNGEVSATSAQAIGTTFTLCLPAASAEEFNYCITERPSAETPRALSVLIADDEAHIRDIMEAALAARGHTATVFKDGHSLLANLRSSRETIDAIIVDNTMPGCSGPELVEAIQKIRPELATILVSGDPSAADRVTKHNSRVSFLAKPFTFEQLYEVLERLASLNEKETDLVAVPRRRKAPSTE